ncbi:MAG: GtrA family protein [Thermoleophilia bacterium]|nr:GtrA family protein [Thermoleophilia bacterium]MDH3724181.1 GtrA family protein [Thermoleophilia bacterium]
MISRIRTSTVALAPLSADLMTSASCAIALARGNAGRFSRFLAVGAAASTVYLGGFALLLMAGVHYLPAGAAALLVAIALNFAINGAWTFGFRRGSVATQAVAFLAIQLAIGALTLALLHLLVTTAVDQVMLAQLLAAGTLAPANYLATQRWGFR